MIKYLKLFLQGNTKRPEDTKPLDILTIQNTENAVFILDNHIISKNKISYYNCNQNIDDIQVLYFTCINNKPLLFIAGKHNSHIPTSSANFLPTFLYLANTLGFNPNLLTIFEETFGCERNMFIWARKNPSNFVLLESTELSDDILLGYEIQNDTKTFISWEASYEDIISLKEVVKGIPDNDDDLIKYSFNVPVRVGNIILDDFAFYDCDRKNIPVANYFSYCECDKVISKPYSFLKNALLGNNSLKNALIDTEEDKSIIYSTKAKTKDLEFYFSNAYPTDLDAANNRVFFLITNLKEYLSAIIYPEYIIKLSIAHCTTLSGEVYLDMVCYKETPHIYRVPTFIQEISQNRPFIWIDDSNQELGFADHQYTHILLLEDVDYMCILNTTLDNGVVESKLCVKTRLFDFLIPMFTSNAIDLHIFEEQIRKDIPIPFKTSFDDYLYK
ncbi:hypothetical protein AV926_18220 [Myroides marinus]|uniref:Uncharacterized protein n=1 Tax=Myroides marinus TaxID=703342 RepID=A0A165Q3S9_9FLAO|nr:hypothetical protein [Myroides marinus]KZE73574.1 hypothetical protein AV926_18220 [Myroides marinus]